MGGKHASNANAPPNYTGIILQTSSEGVCIPIGWGRFRCAPNLIWTGNFYKVMKKNGSKKGGGKGGGGGGKKGGNSGVPDFHAGLMFGICEGPIQEFGQVYANNSITTLATLGFTPYRGTADQPAWTTASNPFAGLSGAPATPLDLAYRQTAYVVTNDYDLGPTPTVPQHNFEVLGYLQGSVPGSVDADPADIIWDFLTNTQYGLGMNPALIGDRTAYSAYCRSMGLLFSPILQAQEQALSILQRWAQLTNTWIFWSANQLKFVPLGTDAIGFTPNGAILSVVGGSTGWNYSIGDIVTVNGGMGDATIKIIDVYSGGTEQALGAVVAFTLLTGGTGYSNATDVGTSGGTGSNFTLASIFVGTNASYTPNLTPIYNLTYEDFLTTGGRAAVTVTRSDPASAYNWTRINCVDRNNQYNRATVEFKDQASIELYGLMQSNDIQATEIADRNIAAVACAILGKRAVYIRNTYAWKTSYNYILLEPGDIVTLTDPTIGLDHFPVRVQTIEEDQDGALSFVAEELPILGGVAAEYATQESLNWVPMDFEADPGNANPPAIIEPPPDVTAGSPQIWIGTSGGPSWGGARVLVSVDDVTYADIGTVGASPQGVLLSPLPAHADPDTVDTLAVDLSESLQLLSSSVTHNDADASRAICLVDGELIGYGAVIPGNSSSYAYDLTYLRRGAIETGMAAHAAGAPFCAIDPGNMLQVPLPQAYVGQTIYIKLQSFNYFGGGLQDESILTRYSYTPVGVAYHIAPPTSPALAITTPSGAVAIAMTLSWAASPGPALGSYEVQWSRGDGSTIWTAADHLLGAGAGADTLTPVVAMTNYEARVRAINGNGQAVSTWAVSAVVNSGAAPPPPGGNGLLPLVNGDLPVGVITDPSGVPVYVLQ